MTNATFPFQNVDMTKVMADFNPAKMVDQFTRIAKNFQIQQIDLDPIIVFQRENIEALTATNKAVSESLQALAARQNEILRKALIEATEAVSELSKADDPQEATAEQADLLKASFETTLRNIKEINKLVAKSNAETSEAINARISELLGELKNQTKKTE